MDEARRQASSNAIRHLVPEAWNVPYGNRNARTRTRAWNRESAMIFADFTDLPVQDSERSSISSDNSSRWDWKDLPEPPYHVFDPSRKKQLVYIVSLAGLFSPLSSNIYFPALNEIAKVSDLLLPRCIRSLQTTQGLLTRDHADWIHRSSTLLYR